AGGMGLDQGSRSDRDQCGWEGDAAPAGRLCARTRWRPASVARSDRRAGKRIPAVAASHPWVHCRIRCETLRNWRECSISAISLAVLVDYQHWELKGPSRIPDAEQGMR